MRRIIPYLILLTMLSCDGRKNKGEIRPKSDGFTTGNDEAVVSTPKLDIFWKSNEYSVR